MSKKSILIANIGNRSIVGANLRALDGKYVPLEEVQIPKNNFREWTQLYWEEQSFEAVSLNILNRLLDELIGKGNSEYTIEKIYLFTSDQAPVNENATSQDTLYAGYLMQQLLARQYQRQLGIQNPQDEQEVAARIEPIVLQVDMVRPKDLIPAYRHHLVEIQKTYPNHQLVICDSGGTPQQKASLKLAAEFIFGQDAEYWQVVEERDANGEVLIGADKGYPIPLDRDEYGKVLLAQQILLLIDHGEYEGAYRIRKEKSSNPEYPEQDIILILLDVLRHRKSMHLHLPGTHKKIVSQDWMVRFRGIPSLNLKASIFPIFNELKKTPLPAIGKSRKRWEKDLNDGHFFDLCEILSWADYLWEIKHLGMSIMMYYSFVEKYIKARVHHFTNLDVYHEQHDDHWQHSHAFTHLVTGKPEDEARYHLPLSEYFFFMDKKSTENPAREINDSLLQCVKTLNRKGVRMGIDKFRNRYAHEGISPTLGEILSHIPKFNVIRKTWNESFGLPDENIYIALNREIREKLKADYV